MGRGTGITARTISYKGDFTKSRGWIERILHGDRLKTIFEKYGDKGVEALSEATPSRTGLTARSWTYDISLSNSEGRIEWRNTNNNNGFNVAIGIQLGHGTKNGGYVAGIDYINPALAPIFKELSEELWEEIKRT